MPDCEWYDGVVLYSLIGEMSIHDKMQADYLWVRHAPVEEGVKVRYSPQHPATTDSSSSTTVPPMPPNASK